MQNARSESTEAINLDQMADGGILMGAKKPRALTMLGKTGDTTIVWDDDADDQMIPIIEKKLSEGCAFFIVEARFFGLLKKTRLVDAEEARKHRALSIPDEDLARFVSGGSGTKPQRKMLRHAAAVAASLIGASQVSTFAHGQTVEIAGSSVVFAATVQGPLTQLGHGGMRIQLRDRAGANLAGLCLYFEDQPTLDQLASLALHIQSGDETELLSTGNLYAVTSDGARHPAIADRAKARDEIIDVDFDLGDFPQIREIAQHANPRFMMRRDLQLAAQARYLGVAGHHYRAATEVAVWGTDVKKLRRFNDLTARK